MSHVVHREFPPSFVSLSLYSLVHSDYLFELPSTTVDRNRPGYGGTCYSEFNVGQTYTITQFDTAGDSVEIQISTYIKGKLPMLIRIGPDTC
jgi:hypothetical protein